MLKLKWLLLLLVCLNALVLAWQWDAFARWGHGPNVHREPERLQQQIRPEAVKFERIQPGAAASLTASPAESSVAPSPSASEAESAKPAARP